MFQIGILGKPNPLRFKVKELLDSHLELNTTTFSSTSQLTTALNQVNFTLLILILESLSQSKIESLRFIDKNFRKIPLLLVSPNIPVTVRKEFLKNNFNNIYLIDSQTESSDLCSVLIKLCYGGTIFHRSFVRYTTNKAGELFHPEGPSYPVNITNLSAGGAQLKFKTSHLNLSSEFKNTEVLLRVYGINKKREPYLIPSQIKWQDPRTGCVGIEFRDSFSGQGKRLKNESATLRVFNSSS